MTPLDLAISRQYYAAYKKEMTKEQKEEIDTIVNYMTLHGCKQRKDLQWCEEVDALSIREWLNI